MRLNNEKNFKFTLPQKTVKNTKISQIHEKLAKLVTFKIVEYYWKLADFLGKSTKYGPLIDALIIDLSNDTKKTQVGCEEMWNFL